EIAQRLRYLRIPTGVQIRDSDVQNYASQDVLCVTTGSQGEPQAALPRIAIDDHRFVKLGPDDTVVFSARSIPGYEKAIAREMSHVARRGADVVTDSMKHVHVSGHGSEEELKLVLSLIRPRYFVPIHGEYRQLSQHARVARRVMSGADQRLQVLLAENGDIIQFDSRGARIADKAPAGRVLIDVTRVGEVGDEVLRDRRHLAGDGVVVAVVAISRHTGALAGDPELVARGFVVDSGQADTLFHDAGQVIASCIAESGVEERTDQGLMTEKLRVELRRFFKKRTGRRPLVLPVLMEICVLSESTLSRRISEFVGVALFALALIWLISLVTHEPSDPVWFFTPAATQLPANFAGRVGAFLSELSLQLFGYAAYLIPAVIAIAGWHYFWCQTPDAAYTKLTGIALLLSCASAFLSLVFGETD